MSRATTKTDLIIAANEQFDKLWKLMETMSDKLQTATTTQNHFCRNRIIGKPIPQ